jgi:hypothetical protein
VHICYNAEAHFKTIPTQFAVWKSDHFLSSYNILKFLKLCAETACGRKFVRLLDPTVHCVCSAVTVLALFFSPLFFFFLGFLGFSTV